MSEEDVLPERVGDVRWRYGGGDETAVVHTVAAAAAEHDEPRNPVSPLSVAELLAGAGRRGLVIGEDGDGPVAFGAVVTPVGAAPVRLVGSVHPRGRGTGTGRRLLAWQIARGRRVLADSPDPAQPLTARVPAGVQPAAHLLGRAGFRPERTFLHLTRPASAPLERLSPPGGLRVVQFLPEHDEPLRTTKNAVFADHWRPRLETAESWARHQLGPRLRRELSRLAIDERGSIAGFVVTWSDPDLPGEAYIALVGTVRDQRGRGIARALLTDVIRASADAGYSLIVIDVDGDSPTRADQLYAGLGFERAAEATVWALHP